MRWRASASGGATVDLRVYNASNTYDLDVVLGLEIDASSVLEPGFYGSLRVDGEALHRIRLPAYADLQIVVTFDHSLGDVDIELRDDQGEVVTGSRGVTNTATRSSTTSTCPTTTSRRASRASCG